MSDCKYMLPPIESLMPAMGNFQPFIIIPQQPVHSDPVEVPKTSKKMKFTPEEDKRLCSLIRQYGSNDWIHISEMMKTRNPRQCRERWNNYLNPNLRDDPWTIEEDKLLIAKYRQFGTHWSKISKFFAHRSDNAIRNRWQMLLRQSERRYLSSSSSSMSDA
ncbi:Myb-like DNA-binding domain containing protein [Trichomonas vaginalis G3]|uniref:Myb-like DNA-binding domain containing protein n=1 Tax=Trichomonas vaginalis (strain ATCC PRA-98 / G3) TaxID=412133 RepID=A2DJL9_TRIV3|nr:RNA polymerase II transcription regulator recruiting protein [Trichomonas vaginalis G3]EAY19419.1 Myb-like DNA-binding domain containing protein [Trichomonas vaginalis G3]KAI5493183.1 RNA polymerase II transcription regulator recruiting protein [Trichomonas vaginalis G3]|eukprot:XP_001580405.1 Myb-like DNA-binding domain containing protein [Trichomonas vaginalis G3]